MLMRQDVIEAARTVLPFLLKVGWSKELSDRWAAGAVEGQSLVQVNFLFLLR